MIRKILFLDCDGVLNRRPSRDEWMEKRTEEESMEFERYANGLNPSMVLRLKRIIDETGAEIVASTSWRHYDDHPFVGKDWRKTLSEMIGRDKGVFAGSTPYLNGEGRGLEIKSWIELNLEPGKFRYCVVDDDVFDIIGVIPERNVVKTDEGVGLTDKDASDIICVLNG